MHIVRAILWGLWRGLDVLRRFLHLVFLLVVFGFVVGALRVSLPTVPLMIAMGVSPAVRPVPASPIEACARCDPPALPGAAGRRGSRFRWRLDP